MSQPSRAVYIEQINGRFKDFLILWPRFMIMLRSAFATSLPDDLALLRERLTEDSSHEGDPKRAALFYRFGVILIHQKQPLSMGELSTALNTSLSTTTRMTDWLVESGFVERITDPEDRRIVRVALTEVGREQYQRIDEFIKQRLEETFSSITPEEWAGLAALLCKLVETLDEVL